MKKMTGPELLAHYNKAAAILGETPVKRFADRTTALKRTAAHTCMPRPQRRSEPATRSLLTRRFKAIDRHGCE